MNFVKAPLRFAIKSLLYLIDPDHRRPETISSDNDKKFTHVVETDFQSDFGRVSKVFRTVPYQIWLLRTASFELTAADKHRVIRDTGEPAWIEDLRLGDSIRTENGVESVIECRSLNMRSHCYCVQVDTENADDPNNHLFYSNGILSHNTTCAAGYLLWKAMFNPDTTVLVVANNLDGAMEIMSRVRYAYENTPDFLKAGAASYNKKSIEFDNGSKIVARATSANSTRGLSISLLYVDEMAFPLSAQLAKDFWTSARPTLGTGGACIITSTPKSDSDTFAGIWKAAIDQVDEYGNPTFKGVGKNDFRPIRVTWDQHPDRDEEWARVERSAIGEQRFRQEHCCEFVTDDLTLIDPIFLSEMRGEDPIGYTGTVRWYKEVEPNRSYLVGLDPALGNGANPAAIQVFELPSMKQVAEWSHNRTPVMKQVEILQDILFHLFDDLKSFSSQRGEPQIFWTVENNNNMGGAALTVVAHTGEDQFPGMLVSEKRKIGFSNRFKGLNTTSGSKKEACARFKSLLESGRMTIYSESLIRELKNFVATANSASAKRGETDDLISATLLCIRMLEQVTAWDESFEELHETIKAEEGGDEPPAYVF